MVHTPSPGLTDSDIGRVVWQASGDRTPGGAAAAPGRVSPAMVMGPPWASFCHEDHAALGFRLTDADLAAPDRAFPPPSGPQPLDML
jgi:hypothetical protein